MTVEEGAATGVFPGQTHRNAFIHQRGVGEVFRAAPVKQFFTRRHRLTVAVDFRDPRLHFNGFRHGTDALRQFLQTLHFHFVRIAFIPLVVKVRRPGERVHIHRAELFHHALTGIQRVAVKVHHFSRIFQRRNPILLQTIGVQLTRRRVLLDFLIHQRLGRARLVGFVMAVTAVAHQIDEHITFKGITEIQRNAGDESHGFRVIGVNVENRRLHHFTDVSTVRRGARIQRVGGRKTDLVVNHDPHGAAHFVAPRFRHVQGFLHHALPGHGGIAVDGDRQHFIAARLVQTIQTRAHGPHHHRADDFQMRRVKRQRQVYQTAFGFDIRREAHVVFHVAGAEVFFMLTGKLIKQILRLFAEHVNQDVQSSTVRHAQHHFAGAAFTGVADHLFEHRDQRIAAFQREAFRAGEFSPQVALQPFCRRQFAEEPFFLFNAKVRVTGHGFDTLLDPAFLFGGGDVHVFRANRTAVGLLQRVQQLAKLHRVFADSKRANVKGFLEICFG